MPLPKPKKGQKESEFISSCMGSEIMKSEYPDQKQRAAVCYSQFRRSKKKKQSKGSSENPSWDEFEKENCLVLLDDV